MIKKIICQELLITIFVFQFLVFYGTSNFTTTTEAPPNIWDKIWYVTEALMYAYFAGYFAVRTRDVRKGAIWKMLAIFLTIRLIWEIYAVIYGWDVNMKIAMAIFFVLISLISFIIIISPYLKKAWKR